MIFSGYSTSFSTTTTTTTSLLLPFITTMSKCTAFHFHHRLLHLHAGLYKNSRIHFTHSTYSPSFFVAAAMATEASAKVIDGKKVAKEIKNNLRFYSKRPQVTKVKIYGVIIKGKRAVVIGRSNIVGMPAALLLQREDATVSVVHSRTKNPEKFIREADIIIAAVGKANMVKGSWVKPGAVIIDVGINPVEDAKSPRGYQLVGDMCCDEASQIASAITPVPGGVGPMTIAMLLSNTLTSAKRIYSLK